MKADILTKLIDDWKHWSKSASKAEDGWQSDFPNWTTLISNASLMMESPSLSKPQIDDIEYVWHISEEDENMADYAKLHWQQCWNVITELAKSNYSDVRWQIYEVLSKTGNKGENILRSGLKDVDAYCRRRALIALAELKPADIFSLAKIFSKDSDDLMRGFANELLKTNHL